MSLKKVEKHFRKALSKLPPEWETIAKGLISYVPGIMRYSDVTHSIDAEYCYSTYLAHLNQAHRVGLDPFPKVVAELGPGTSFGVGTAALLCGANVYYAIDELPHAKLEANLWALDQLVGFFRTKKDPEEERGTRKTIDRFPGHVLTDDILEQTLDDSRIEQIKAQLRKAITGEAVSGEGQIKIIYLHPFKGSNMLKPRSVDMIMSTVVLQVVEDLPEVYSCFSEWLKPGAWMSHFVDFSNYGMTRDWNGHWGCSRFLWRLMQGNRPYLHNRAPYSVHIELMKMNGFDIVTDIRTLDYSGIGRKSLNEDFAYLTDDDIIITRALIQAVKRRSD